MDQAFCYCTLTSSDCVTTSKGR